MTFTTLQQRLDILRKLDACEAALLEVQVTPNDDDWRHELSSMQERIREPSRRDYRLLEVHAENALECCKAFSILRDFYHAVNGDMNDWSREEAMQKHLDEFRLMAEVVRLISNWLEVVKEAGGYYNCNRLRANERRRARAKATRG